MISVGLGVLAAEAPAVVPLKIAGLVHRFRMNTESVHQDRDLGRRHSFVRSNLAEPGGYASVKPSAAAPIRRRAETTG
jgi:hypothetical protein